jgi:acrylyl-CoA reductase (NADPH)
MHSFRAFRISNDGGRIHGDLVTATLDELGAGDVVIRAAYSSVNYKDALAATGTGKILKRFPLIGGIDVSGTVMTSQDPRFREGDEVLVTGYDLGVGTDGGFAGVVRVPGDWVVPLPQGLSLRDAMVYGTAGFTAGLAVVRLEQNGLRPGTGPVAVTGATGGVGSIAVGVLSRLGYEVTAITGKDDAHEYLRALGAAQVLSRGALELGTRPLERATWAGAVDAAGGDLLAWLVRSAAPWNQPRAHRDAVHSPRRESDRRGLRELSRRAAAGDLATPRDRHAAGCARQRRARDHARRPAVRL